MSKLHVNESCIGCGLCVSSLDKYFEFDDEGLSHAKDVEIAEEEKKEVLNVVDSCPAQAITVEE